MKILLDTDIGYSTDADDAIALAYLLLHPDCELAGVTTVGLHSDWRADCVDCIAAELGQPDLPIVAGADRPLFPTQYWMENPVRPWPAEAATQPRRTYPPNRAVTYLQETIRSAAPGTYRLVTIGQFTNLATLLLIDPEAVGMLEAVISMGGRTQHPPEGLKGECNVILDPVAAGIVCERLGTTLTLLPIEAVRGMGLSAQMLTQMLAREDLAAVQTCCWGWKEQKGASGVGLADPMTVAMAMQPALATCRTGRIRVHLHDHPLPSGEPFAHNELTGTTHFAPDPNGPHRLVTAAEKEQTHQHLLEVFRTG